MFQVQDTTGQVFDRSGQACQNVGLYGAGGFEAKYDLADAFARRSKATAIRNAVPLPGQVFIENNASNIASVIELTGQNRSGFTQH